jgi:Ser/Thr protein kinase RdoA (MazF antagonist)
MSQGCSDTPAWRAARAWATQEHLRAVCAHGAGLINSTYLVTTDHGRFILQRLNRHVFEQPQKVTANLRVLCDHASQRGGMLQVPRLLRSRSGGDEYCDVDGEYWRALSYIDRTRCLQRIDNLQQAQQVGLALGRFHGLFADLDPAALADTLPGFHIAPRYLQQYDHACHVWRGAPTSLLSECMAFIATRRDRIDVLEAAKDAGLLPLRVMHGDPKLNNFLFANDRDEVVSLIDLDTVKPGLLHYDIGDCLRSACNCSGEDAPASNVVFDIAIARAILEGYGREGERILGSAEKDYLYPAIWLIPLELGLRFLSDYLEGNRYFRCSDPAQNLRRACIQFALVRSIESQETDLRRSIAAMATHHRR